MQIKPMVGAKASLIAFMAAPFFSACGGAPGNNPNYTPPDFDPSSSSGGSSTTSSSGGTSSSSSGGSTSSGGGGNITYLDCTNLDPDKVYIHGTLNRGFSVGFDALFAPENPTEFCVGFADGINTEGLVTPRGTYVYESSAFPSSLDEMVQEELIWDADDSEWSYPNNPEDNDRSLVGSLGAVGTILIHPDVSNETVYFRNHSNGDIYTSVAGNETVYYTRAMRDTLLGVMPDGSLLFGGSSGLMLLDNELNLESLTSPVDANLDFFGVAKLYTDGSTGNQSAWVYLDYNDDVLRRWHLDLVTKEVTNDGELAALPEGVTIASQTWDNGRFDGDGNLWLQGSMEYEGVFSSVAVKLPLSGAGNSTIEYIEADYTGEADWTKEPNPRVAINSNRILVTGP